MDGLLFNGGGKIDGLKEDSTQYVPIPRRTVNGNPLETLERQRLNGGKLFSLSDYSPRYKRLRDCTFTFMFTIFESGV